VFYLALAHVGLEVNARADEAQLMDVSLVVAKVVVDDDLIGAVRDRRGPYGRPVRKRQPDAAGLGEDEVKLPVGGASLLHTRPEEGQADCEQCEQRREKPGAI
jgi:hypothetical protein